MENRSRLISEFVLTFLTGFFFIYFLYAGLPFDFTADYWEAIGYANKMSFGKLIELTLLPFTPGWFFIDNIVYLRPLTILFFKFNETFFGPGAGSFIISEAICCGIVLCEFFYIALGAGGNRLYAWLGNFLYLTFPPFFFATMSFPHMEYFNTFLRLSGLILFGLLTLKPRRPLSFTLTTLACYVFVLLSIKLRSSDKLIPVIFILFLIFGFRSIRQNIGKIRYAVLCGVSLLMLLSVVPIRIPQFEPAFKEDIGRAYVKEGQIKSYRIENLYHSLIHHPEGEFPFTTPRKRKPPRSLTECYGFGLGFLFWIVILASLSRGGFQTRPYKNQERLSVLKHFHLLFLITSGLFAFCYLSNFISGEIRYLTFILTPTLPLFLLSLFLLESRMHE